MDETINNPINPMYLYSKQVKGEKVKSDLLNRQVDKERVSTAITSLKEIGKQRSLEEFELRDNCKEWVYEILGDCSKSKEAEYLLNDFTDSMMTRMREKGKFAFAVVSEGSLLLCHSSIGEQIITPAWEGVNRMFDKDNVEHFVLFQKKKGITTVAYYEHSPSEFFTRWLGMPEREAFFYLGGKNRIYVDIDGIDCALELSEDEVEEKLLKRTSPFKVEKNQLIFSKPIEKLRVNQIRRGKKRYKSIEDFLQDYLARKYELSYYQEAYRKIAGSLDPMLQKHIDDFDRLVTVSSNGEQVKVRKRNPNFEILFAGKSASSATIEMRESYFDRLFTNFLNETRTRVFHAGMEMYPQSYGPFKIGSLEIFNKIESNTIITNLLEFSQKINILDDTLKRALYYSIFLLLSKINEKKPISYFFTKFANELGEGIHKSGIVLHNETGVIEFKSRDYLIGKDEDVSKRISEDVKSKISYHPFKIYFFGINDKTKKMDHLTSSRLSSDRVDSLEKKIAKELGNKMRVTLLKLPLDTGDECLLIMLVVEDNNI